MQCPECKKKGERHKLIQRVGNEVTMRIKGALSFRDGQCRAKCYWCGNTVTLPLRIAEGTQIPGERHLLRNRS